MTEKSTPQFDQRENARETSVPPRGHVVCTVTRHIFDEATKCGEMVYGRVSVRVDVTVPFGLAHLRPRHLPDLHCQLPLVPRQPLNRSARSFRVARKLLVLRTLASDVHPHGP